MSPHTITSFLRQLRQRSCAARSPRRNRPRHNLSLWTLESLEYRQLLSATPAQIATGVTSFALAPDHSAYYIVIKGVLDKYTFGVGWQYSIATNVTSFALSPNGKTCYFVSNGNLDAYTSGVGWQWDIAANVTSFTLAPDNSAYYFVSNGTLDKYTFGVGWQYSIATNVTSFALSPNGKTYYFVSNGNLDAYTSGVGWQWNIAANVTSFAVDNSAYYFVSNGTLDKYTFGVGWQYSIATNVTSLSLSPDGQTYYFVSNGDLDAYTSGVGWQWNIATGVTSAPAIFVGLGVQKSTLTDDGNQLYWLDASGQLQSLTISTGQWESLATNVVQYDIRGDGAVCTLHTDNCVFIDGSEVWAPPAAQPGVPMLPQDVDESLAEIVSTLWDVVTKDYVGPVIDAAFGSTVIDPNYTGDVYDKDGNLQNFIDAPVPYDIQETNSILNTPTIPPPDGPTVGPSDE